MGHAFGIMHDGDGNECTQQKGMIMAPVLQGPSYGTYKWSYCARRNLNAFLHAQQSWCLSDTHADSEEIAIPRQGFSIKKPSVFI
jgi:hypothetical protein